MIGSLSICTVLYALMCVVITGMVPYDRIDNKAPFSVAFTHIGLDWTAKLVAVGAIAGVVTTLVVSLLGQSRIYVVLAREGLIPRMFADINP